MTGIRSNCGEVRPDGYHYQLYTLLHCVSCLRKNENVQEYQIGNAVEGFGALDDVVFEATLKDGKRMITAIQVKHTTKPENIMIDERYLRLNPKTFVYKYFESFMEIRKTKSLEQLGQFILWTNMAVHESILDWFEGFVPDFSENDMLGEGNGETLPHARYVIKAEKQGEIIDKCLETTRKSLEKDGSRSKRNKDFQEPSKDDLQHFFKRLVFYVKMPNVDELKSYLTRNIPYFDDLCKLVESCAVKQTATSDQINKLFTIINLRNSMEVGPYTKLIFNDSDKLQCKVKELFDNGASTVLRVKAAQDVDCTVARLVTVVEKCLAADSKHYLVFRYQNFKQKWNQLEGIVKDSKLVKIGVKCIIVSYVTDDEVQSMEKYSSGLKFIFVGENLTSDFDDEFDVNCLDDQCKQVIQNRIIRLSQNQSATLSGIFSEKLFQKENSSMVLEVYKLHEDSVLQVTVNDPPLDIHYLPRTATLSSVNNCANNERSLPRSTINLIEQAKFDKLIIHGQPGMGKTTEMVKLCSDFRGEHCDHLVVYIHCREAVSKQNDIVKDLICDSVTACSKLTNTVIEKMIQLGKIILIMDGYDEVSKNYNKELQRSISAICRIKFFKLYIATRSQCKDEIKNILGRCGLCHLEPFSKENQLAYLENFWNSEKENDDRTQAINAEKASCIIAQFRSMMNESENEPDNNSENEDESRYNNSLIGIPLQTYMIAVIYKDRILSPDFEVSESHTLGFVFKEFVELKFLESVKRNYDPTNNAHAQTIDGLRTMFLYNHVLAAVVIHLGAQDKESQLLLKHLCESIQHYGLVVTRPDISFIHFTYLEYFLALHLLTNSIDNDRMKTYVHNLLFRGERLVDRFVNYLLDHIDPTAALNHSFINELTQTSANPTDYVQPRTLRVHAKKMVELNAALYNLNATEINQFLAHLIYNRMLNLFEVIYGSLSEKIKFKVRLCFDLTCDFSNSIHICCSFLSKIGEEDVLNQVLSIILKSNTDKEIILSYLMPINDQAVSVLELMCNPKYSRLFESFTTIIAQLNKKQRSALMERLEKRLENCFRTIIEFSNIDLMKRVTNWIKNKYTVEATGRFLTSNNHLPFFVKNIANWNINESDSTNELTKYQLVRIVIDMYCWAFNGHIPSNTNYFWKFDDHLLLHENISDLIQNIESMEISLFEKSITILQENCSIS